MFGFPLPGILIFFPFMEPNLSFLALFSALLYTHPSQVIPGTGPWLLFKKEKFDTEAATRDIMWKKMF